MTKYKGAEYLTGHSSGQNVGYMRLDSVNAGDVIAIWCNYIPYFIIRDS